VGAADRLGYLWHLRRDRSDLTEVSVRFAPRDDGGTRVEIEHTGWERLGAEGATWRGRNEFGWLTLLPHYVSAVTGRPAGGDPSDHGDPMSTDHPTHHEEDRP